MGKILKVANGKKLNKQSGHLATMAEAEMKSIWPRTKRPRAIG